MTTAARPTFEPARGGSGRTENDLGAMSKQYSSRDLPAHTKLKYRQDGQSSISDLKGKDFKRELESKEKLLRENKKTKSFKEITSSAPSAPKRSKAEVPLSTLDADDPLEDEEEEEDEDDDDDDAAELMAELAKIKKERAMEQAKKEAEKMAEEERVRMENIIRGNPLLNQDKTPSEFKVKRRWDDDVVFKNCSRKQDEKKKNNYINDTLRSEFHKKFMDKYIK